MMPRERSVREVVETRPATLANIALTNRLGVVMDITRGAFTTALGTPDALRPTRLADEFETLRLIEQARQIDQDAHGSSLLRFGWKAIELGAIAGWKTLDPSHFDAARISQVPPRSPSPRNPGRAKAKISI